MPMMAWLATIWSGRRKSRCSSAIDAAARSAQHRHVGITRQAVGQHGRHHRRRRSGRQACSDGRVASRRAARTGGRGTLDRRARGGRRWRRRRRLRARCRRAVGGAPRPHPPVADRRGRVAARGLAGRPAQGLRHPDVRRAGQERPADRHRRRGAGLRRRARAPRSALAPRRRDRVRRLRRRGHRRRGVRPAGRAAIRRRSPACSGAAIGSAVTLRLLDRSPTGAAPKRPRWAGSTAASSSPPVAFGGWRIGVASIGGWLRARVPAASALRRGTLPAADRTTPIPAGASLPIDGLTPYVTSAARFYRIDTATFVPVIDVDAWRLRITGMVDQPASYSYDELAGARPRRRTGHAGVRLQRRRRPPHRQRPTGAACPSTPCSGRPACTPRRRSSSVGPSTASPSASRRPSPSTAGWRWSPSGSTATCCPTSTASRPAWSSPASTATRRRRSG